MVEEISTFCVQNLTCCAMRAPSKTCSHSRISRIAKPAVLVAALHARACAATLPTPPSSADKWLYPDVNTLPTYNYLDTVNASWTSNFVVPYLLLRCHHPNDTVHYAYPYNQSVSATGSTLVPLDDGNAWTCHFQVSDLSPSSVTAPTFISNDFNIVLDDGQKPVLWTESQDAGENAASSATSNPTTASPRTSKISTTPSVTTTPNSLSSPASTLTPTPTASSPTATSSATPPVPTKPSTSPSPSSTTGGLSKSEKIAIIVGSTMGALLLLVIALAVSFILRTRRSERNAVVYRSGPGNGYGGEEVSGSEAPRERWKGVDIPSGRMQGYF